MATIYPFLAFQLPSVGYVRRWLAVDADDTAKKGGNHNFSRGKDDDDVVVEDNFRNGLQYPSGYGVDDDSDGTIGDPAAAPEAVALDLALPEAGLDPKKPFYIVLHGLNGGSAEVLYDV